MTRLLILRTLPSPRQYQRRFNTPCQYKSLTVGTAKSTTPSSSADTTTSSTESLLRQRHADGLSVTPPRAIFPWRHEAEPLPRLVHGTGQYTEQGGVFGPGVPFPIPWYMPYMMETLAGTRLQVPWYKVLGSEWKHELAQSCAWAFSQGVAGVLSNTYRVRFDDIQTNDDETTGIHFRHMAHESSTENDSPAQEQDNDYCQEVEYMLEEKLRHLYETAHECGKGQMEIRLQSKPVSAQLQSLFWIPFLTRAMVKDKPALRHSYNFRPEIIKRCQQLGRPLSRTESIKLGMEWAERLTDECAERHAEGDVWLGTVVVQVSVQSDEVFCVTDLKTGAVVQGHGDEKIRRVTHLVRLENVVETEFPVDGSNPINRVGSWVITDWDDLLDGNLWLSL